MATLGFRGHPVRILLVVAAALTTVSPSPVASQARSAGQEAVLAFEAARADAYRNLLESVQGLRVEGSTTVQNLAVASSETRASLESFVRGAAIIEETMEPDGTAKVVVEIDLDRLERLLGRKVEDGVRRIRMEGYGAPRSPEQTPGSSATGASSQVGSVVTGNPRAWNRDGGGSAPAQLQSVVTVVGQAAQDPTRARSAAQARLMAERAATNDAYRRLLEYVYGISVSSNTTVRDLALANDKVDSEVSGFIRGARIEGVRHTDDGVAEVTMSLDLAGLRRVLVR